MDIDILVEQVHRLLLDHLPIKTSKTPSGWRTMDCPMCTDKRKRGGLITTGAKISYNCFNCGFTTGWEPNPTLGKKYKDLADKLGATAEEIHKAQIEILKYAEILETEQETDYVYNLQKFDTVRLPESVISLDDLDIDHPVKKYAIDRGIDGLYPLMFFNEPLYKQRLVVPFTYNNELVGWTGRHINPPDKTTPKYLHNMPSGYVFNIDRFADSKREIVIVTEGVFDAIMIDGIAIQGNSVGPEQAHLIEKLGKRIIICPDRDEAGTELMLQAAELGWEVSFPPWHADCKDAADAVIKYGRLATVDSIIRNAVDNELKIKVRAKMV
jgi:hypothetical protein